MIADYRQHETDRLLESNLHTGISCGRCSAPRSETRGYNIKRGAYVSRYNPTCPQCLRDGFGNATHWHEVTDAD